MGKSLPTIDQAIPTQNVCHKIAVDGGSTDKTADVLREYGWTLETSPKRGIPYQANHALKLVDSDFFASFEHDIILNKNWYARTSSVVEEDRKVGAVQGIRLYVGSKTMQAIEEWQYRANLIPRWVYSVDNNLFRTEAVRRAGGFSDECMASADGILRRNMFKLGYEWITDGTLISGHYRKNFLEHFKHQMRAMELARYYWSYNPETARGARRVVSILGGDPRFVVSLAIRSRMLRVPLAWYILRLEKGLYVNLPHESKAVKRVAMDHFYLIEFENAVVRSSKDITTQKDGFPNPRSNAVHHSCEWCGSAAISVYRVPPGWSLILPRLHRANGDRLFVCSENHARKIAERLFKNAFEYITKDN